MNHPGWRLESACLPLEDRLARAVIFTTGNGVYCCNGTPPLALAGLTGAFAGGLYGEGPAELTWVPEPGHFARDNERYPDAASLADVRALSLAMCPHVFHANALWDNQAVSTEGIRQTLDLAHGVLRAVCRGTVAGREVFTLESERFISLHDKHVACEELRITPSCDGELTLRLLLDATRLNLDTYDLWAERTCAAADAGVLWQGRTRGPGAQLAVSLAATAPETASRRACTDPCLSGIRFDLAVRAGEPLVFRRLVRLASSVLDASPVEAVTPVKASAAVVDAARHAHVQAWSDVWAEWDIEIDGPDADQLVLRYNLFQLRCALPPSAAYPIGAKFLSGEWYRGCAFWDDDAFVLPCLCLLAPQAARDHVMNRVAGLAAARSLAERAGLPGARYPWEAWPWGEDATADWLVLSATQLHVTADVVWGLMAYVRLTGETGLLAGSGGEVLAETARCWMGVLEETERGLELPLTCGPDEYHPKGKNSIYTAKLVEANLRWAAESGAPARDEERAQWRAAAERIFKIRPDANGVIEQYEGFFALPEAPADLEDTETDAFQLIKQADVLMLPLLFPDDYSEDMVQANYAYYEPRTTHDSSLSPGSHAILACRLGLSEDAYRYFHHAAYMDLHDRQGKVTMGLHAACTANTIRAVVEGFAGLHFNGSEPRCRPNLPAAWDGLCFRFWYQGKRYSCDLHKTQNNEIVMPALQA